MEREPQQRKITWTQGPSGPIASFVVTCTSDDGLDSDVRTVEVTNQPTTQAIIGNGEGLNAPLPLGAQYNCSVVARNAAGNSSSVVSDPFRVGPVINSDTKQQVYDTIQGAIYDAGSGQTISVGRGEYREYVDIDRPISLLGPNAGVVSYNTARSAVNPSRNPEAIILPPVEDNIPRLFGVQAMGVSIEGFYFKLPLSDSTTVDAVSVVGNADVGGLVVLNNIVDGGYYPGSGEGLSVSIAIVRNSDTCSANGLIENVVVRGNLILETDNQAIYLQCASGVVEGNVIINAYSGVQIQPYTSGTSGIVANNSMAVYTRGIYMNYFSESSPKGLWEVENNMVLGVLPISGFSTSYWNGIRFETINRIPDQNPYMIVKDNDIEIGEITTSDVAAIYFKNYKKVITGSLTLTGNSINGRQDITFISAENDGNSNLNGLIDDAECQSLLNGNNFSPEAAKVDPLCTINPIV